MDKPTCGTCPYWDKIIDPEWPKGVFGGEGECHRWPPERGKRVCNHGYADRDWPTTIVDPEGLGVLDWCGEHPLMGEYIKSSLLKKGNKPEENG